MYDSANDARFAVSVVHNAEGTNTEFRPVVDDVGVHDDTAEEILLFTNIGAQDTQVGGCRRVVARKAGLLR
ncbi:hypothetical protein PC128_g6028 [Phytophthora cactorum]|nr:hypothetical protein PC128_g6028 [Phytophthora cactorum]